MATKRLQGTRYSKPSPLAARGFLIRLIAVFICAAVASSMVMSAYPSIRERLFRLAPVASTESVPVLCIRFLLILMPLLVIGAMIAFGVKPVGMWMHHHRFILGASVIAACVLLNISGSSIGMWNYWLGHDMSTDVVWEPLA